MKKRRFRQIAIEMARIYSKKRVSRSAAALSYFLTLSIFPMLICLYAMLGNILPSTEAVLEFAEGLLPGGTLATILEYFNYISINQSPAMLMAGLALMATTSATVFRTLNTIMGDIQGKSRFQGFFSLVVSFILSIVFLAVVYFAVVVMVTGNWFINFLEEEILTFISFSNSWGWFRFLLLFALLLLIVYGVYVITMPRGAHKSLMPGTIAATTAMVIVSIIFSWFIGLSARYPLVYGSLASIIILMLWLYIIGNILIMGNVLNVVLRKSEGDGGTLVKDEQEFDPKQLTKTVYSRPKEAVKRKSKKKKTNSKAPGK